MSYKYFERLRKRTKLRLRYTVHACRSMLYYNTTKEDVLRVVQSGRIIAEKCSKPNKICVANYDGKKDRTTVVIAVLTPLKIKVITIWQKKGK